MPLSRPAPDGDSSAQHPQEDALPTSWEGYARATVRIHLPSGPVQVRPLAQGVTQGAFPTPGARPICIVTAHNPAGRPTSPEVNIRNQRRLVEQLDAEGIAWVPAAGGDEAWLHVEDSVAVLGVEVERAADLGRAYGQDAIFAWTPTRWQVVACADGSAVASAGWQVETGDAALAAADAAYRALGLHSPYVSSPEVDEALWVAREQGGEEAYARLQPHHRVLYSAARRIERERQRLRDEEMEQRRAARRVIEEKARRRAEAEARVREEEERAREEAARLEREAEAERRRAARALAREEHRRNVEAGWPTAWRPRMVEEWTAGGGTVEQAATLARRGWLVKDVRDALRVLGSARGVVAPDRGPAHHEAFGDSLVSVLAGWWPTAPDETLASVKRTFAGGRQQRWFVVGEGDGVRVEAHERRGSGEWVVRPGGTFATLRDAVEGVVELRRVRPRVRTTWHVPGVPTGELLGWWARPTAAAIRGVDPADPADLDAEGLWLDAPWMDALPHRRTLTTVGDEPVVGVRVGSRRQWLALDPTVDGEDLAGHEVARCTWYSESGGAPISWDGGNALRVVADGLLHDHQWGDQGVEHAFCAWPAGTTAQARVIGEWIVRLGLELPAALVLEDWPHDEQWLEWYSVPIWLDLEVDAEVLTALRRRLGRLPTYRDARHAVRHPRSVLGRRLAVALAAAAESEFSGDLYGRWQYVDLP